MLKICHTLSFVTFSLDPPSYLQPTITSASCDQLNPSGTIFCQFFIWFSLLTPPQTARSPCSTLYLRNLTIETYMKSEFEQQECDCVWKSDTIGSALPLLLWRKWESDGRSANPAREHQKHAAMFSEHCSGCRWSKKKHVFTSEIHPLQTNTQETSEKSQSYGLVP